MPDPVPSAVRRATRLAVVAARRAVVAARLGVPAVLLIAALVAPPAGSATAQAPACLLGGEIRPTSCRLGDGATVEGTLGADGSATYRLDALGPAATVALTLRARGGSTAVSVLDWRGQVIAAGLRADDAPDVRVQASLPLPGTYAVRVTGDLPPDAPTFQLTAALSYAGSARQAVWPAALAAPTGALTGERKVVRTPRGGSPAAGLAVAQALGAPPDGVVADFVLVADVQFERIVGASAFTVRFRYEPEAGGGSGYILAIDPVAGTATLDGFQEGQRHAIIAGVPLPVQPAAGAANRLVLEATGPSIRVTLDGQPVFAVVDDRFPRGLIAVGVVTWSDPVAALFDHIQVTIPTP